jgi:AraC-like DNA-binding protein
VTDQDLAVPTALQPWIAQITVATTEPQLLVLTPDPATSLVWRVTAAGESDVLVAGPRTRAAYHHGKQLPLCMKLRIRPGLTPPFLGIAADEIVDRVVPLSQLWGRSAVRLGEELAELDPAAAVDRLAQRLTRRLPQGTPERADLVRAAVEVLSSTAFAPMRVGEAAGALGVGERYLRKIFGPAVGVSPKQFAGIARVRKVLAGAQGGSWSGLAAEAGYYDQSHLVAEFRRLMRVTPGAFAAGRVPTTTC